ncbi:MFS transporter [Peribacillus psychrosaccharolyticus]|uniref:MFS transporter n=1 Tax=Peribacillus psychrosaccharolyticus TaxID=1407 RepID=A0A974NN07_PERPY|nr:MFS transporter [Peribacillus psychrosaccharolyticus]MEC2056280.1 MFS transporter [Peribacillus psychrosaccharolyticus]MED3743682.1 MFS transporter [Peribacillus psychrosaccharolyticus]QQT00548.1 MFS transporter [Peribacillus psychrosaccharolyticus]
MNFFTFNKTIQIRLLLQFLTTLSTMTVLPYIIIYFSKTVGIFITGFMFIFVLTASMIGSLTGGYAADHVGRKKVIVLSETIVSYGFACVALVNSPLFTMPYVTFFLFMVIYFFSGAAEPAYQALLIDVSSPDNRRSIYTYSYWLRNLAISIGGIIGAFLFFNHHFILYIGIALCLFISLVITISCIKETYTPIPPENIPKKRNTFLKGYSQVLKHKSFTAFIVANLLLISMEEQLTNYMAIRLTNNIQEPQAFLFFKADGINLVGILKSENTLLIVLFTIVISYFVKKYNDRFVILLGVSLYFLGYIMISLNDVPLLLIAAMFIATLGEMIYLPAKQTLLADLVPDHARSTYMAAYSLFSFIGISTAGIFILISTWLPAAVMSSIFGCMGLLCLLIYLRLTEVKRHSSHGTT